MKLLLILSPLFLICGIVMLALPIHMQMTGLVLLLLGLTMGIIWLFGRRPGGRARTFISVLAVLAASGVVCLMAAMNIITTSGQSDWERAETSEYAIVLGAAVREDGEASRIMRQRLKAAQELMERNPQVIVILSGGQGEDESVSEARCMYDTMVEMGADPERLLLEENSFDTRDNLTLSNAIIEAQGGTDKPIALITSEFHQRRANFIAKLLGLDTCSVSSHTDQWFYRVNYTLREVFAFVKAYLQS